MAAKTGVYPVFTNKFKIGSRGRASEEGDMVAIAELEKKCFSDPWSFSMLADTFFNENVLTAAAEEGGKIVG